MNEWKKWVICLPWYQMLDKNFFLRFLVSINPPIIKLLPVKKKKCSTRETQKHLIGTSGAPQVRNSQSFFLSQYLSFYILIRLIRLQSSTPTPKRLWEPLRQLFLLIFVSLIFRLHIVLLWKSWMSKCTYAETLLVTGVQHFVQLQVGNALHLKTSSRHRLPSSVKCTAMLPENGTPLLGHYTEFLLSCIHPYEHHHHSKMKRRYNITVIAKYLLQQFISYRFFIKYF